MSFLSHFYFEFITCIISMKLTAVICTVTHGISFVFLFFFFVLNIIYINLLPVYSVTIYPYGTKKERTVGTSYESGYVAIHNTCTNQPLDLLRATSLKEINTILVFLSFYFLSSRIITIYGLCNK